MKSEKKNIFNAMNLDDIDKIDEVIGSTPKKKLGRPKLNPHAQEQKITTRVPKKVYRQLRIASAMTGKPMGELIVDALLVSLKEYEDK